MIASLNQLTGFVRGPLSDSDSDGLLDTVATPSRTQGWDFDALGNWQSISTDGTTHIRTHNAQNQLTSVDSWPLTYDANGNMTTDQSGRMFVYDAWNRLVAMKNTSAVIILTYDYDALDRRIGQYNGKSFDFYLSDQWQVLEERFDDAPIIQYV